MEAVEQHRRGVERSCTVVAGIGEDQWDNATPCEQWSLRELVNHLTAENRWAVPILDGATVEEVGDRFEGDLLGDDPIGAHEEAARAAHAKAQQTDPQTTVHLSFGDVDAAFYLAQRALDMVVHAWDVAVASGQDAAMDEALADVLYRQAEPTITPEVRAAGVFGPEVPVDSDATPSERLLGLVGRDPGRGR